MAERLYTTREICLKCVDQNEVLYDEYAKYLKKINAKPLAIPESQNKQLLTNMNACQELFKLFLKQRIILNEPCVRFKPANDVAGLQAQVDDMELTKDLKEVFRDISKSGYTFLKDEQLVGNHVEFDCTRYACVDAFGKRLNVMGDFDMISILEESNDKTYNMDKLMEECSKDLEPTPTSHEQNKNSDNKGTENKQAKTKRNMLKIQQSKKEKAVEENTKDDNTRNTSGRAFTTFCVTGRNYISAVDIIRQLISLHMLDISYFYFLVWHVGPLVENQELVLYSYTPPDGSVEICKSSGDLHIDQLEKTFRDSKGKQLQVLADLKIYFKYLVYDCPGVKDSQADKKDRYERYMAKKAKKKELKRQQKGQDGTESSVSTERADSPDDGISMHESLWSTSAQTDEDLQEENDLCA